MSIEKRFVSGKSAEVKHADPLPANNEATPGLVAAKDRVVVYSKDRGMIVLSSLPWMRRKKGDAIFLEIMDQVRTDLAKDLEEKGLLGEHPLVSTQILRESQSRSQGSIEGSLLFGISGNYEASSGHETNVLFAWQTARGKVIFSETNLKDVEIVLDEGIEVPTVEFEFDAEQLTGITMGSGLAPIRREFAHPNGYIERAASRVLFKTNTPDNLLRFLTAGKSN